VEDTAAHNQYPSAEPSRQFLLGPKTGPKTGGHIDQLDRNVSAGAIKQCFGAATMRGRREVSTLYSRRQLLANAAIAASRVGSKPCV
jgi:hypothetical protein